MSVDVPADALVLFQLRADAKSSDPGAKPEIGLFEPTDYSPAQFVTGLGDTGGQDVTGPFSSWTVLDVTPGHRTFKLVYRVNADFQPGTACFRERQLWITVFPVTNRQ